MDRPANAPVGSIGTGQNLALTFCELLQTRQLLAVVITNLGLDATPDAPRESLGPHVPLYTFPGPPWGSA